MQGFIWGEWNWPISCLNDSETQERHSMPLEPSPPPLPASPGDFGGFDICLHSIIPVNLVPRFLHWGDLSTIRCEITFVSLNLKSEGDPPGWGLILSGEVLVKIVLWSILWSFTSSQAILQETNLHYLLHSTSSLTNWPRFWKGQLVLVQD